MKKFNKTLLAGAVAATLLMSAGVTYAKGGFGSDRYPTERFDYIFTQLNLTEEQRSTVLDVLETSMEAQRETMRDSMWALRDQDERPSREQMQALMESHQATLYQTLTDQLNTVLSPEVTAEFIEYMDAHHAMGGMGGWGSMGGRGGMGHHDGPYSQGKRF